MLLARHCKASGSVKRSYTTGRGPTLRVCRLADFRRACACDDDVERTAYRRRGLDALHARARDDAALEQQLVALVRARIEAAPAAARARTGVARRLLDAVCGRPAAESHELAHYGAILAALQLEAAAARSQAEHRDASTQHSQTAYRDASTQHPQTAYRDASTQHTQTARRDASTQHSRPETRDASTRAEAAVVHSRAPLANDAIDEYADIERRLAGVASLYEVIARIVRRADPMIDAYERSLDTSDQQLSRARDVLAQRSAHVSSHSRTSSLCCPRVLGCSLANELRAASATLLGFLVLATLVSR